MTDLHPQPAPFGTWGSPLSAERVALAGVRVSAPRVGPGAVYWVESRPAEGGRHVIVRRSRDGETTDVTPSGFSARSRVHEYGGGAYAVHGATVFFTNQADQRIYRQRPGEDPAPLTAAGPWRHADLTFDAAGQRLLCVREELSADLPEPRSAVVSVRGDAPGDDPGRVLAAGPAFHASPRLSPDGRQLAWITWDHPDMPWDASVLWLAELDGTGLPRQPQPLAGGPGESTFQPEWGPGGSLYFVSDRSGWWNLYCWQGGSVSAVAPMEAEFGVPHWLFGMSTYAVLADGSLACAYTRSGTWRLAHIDPVQQRLRTLETPWTALADLQADRQAVVCVAASPQADAAVVRLDPLNGRVEGLRPVSPPALPPEWIAPPESIEFTSTGGARACALFYRPHNPDYTGPAGERPPLLVRCHGGPTAAAAPVLDPVVQFWTTRGFAVVNVNYGGSSGFGRAYRDRLLGEWGVVDLQDAVAAVDHLAATGRIDGARVAIRGGSAGGYTVLAGLAFTRRFAAGINYFGIADLEALAADTHKFESRYMDRLIAPLPAGRDVYRARSPIHHLESFDAALITFQGSEDKAVPPEQSRRITAAVRARGRPVAYIEFAGEQHGFRKADNIARALEAELCFLGRIFGFAPANAIEPVPIDNLPD